MLTGRERQLLDWIAENPMISQRELAVRAGITRSSVAVHISNLMKKGCIAGKGYVVRTQPYALVIGAANIDIFGRPKHELVENDSNPGYVSLTVGGVGRNIAHNLALLDTDVKLISIFGNDAYADQLKKSCGALGIDISQSIQTENASTSVYMFISDTGGEMQLAISDMEIYNSLTPKTLASKLDFINNAAVVVVDTNLPQGTLEYIAENCTVPLVADAVSTAKVCKLAPILSKLTAVKVNRLEASILTGISADTTEGASAAAKKLLDEGIRNVYITLGEKGVLCADADGVRLLGVYETEVLNTTGAGDSFTAGVACSMIDGKSIVECAKFGTAASSVSISGYDTVNPKLTKHLAETISNQIKEVIL